MASISKIGKSWRVLVRRKGHKSICKTLPTKARAEAFARQAEADIDRGLVVRPADHGLLVGDLVREYRAMRDKSDRPILDTATEHYMLRRLSDSLGDLSAGTLSVQDLLNYAATRRDDGAGPYTINMELSKLGTVMRYTGALLRVVLPDVVAQARPLLTHLRMIGGGGKRERRPTEDEVAAICAEVAPWLADVVLFAIYSAMRRGEIVRIRWADLDETKRLVLVRDRKDPRRKSGNDQWVPLLPNAWSIVQAQPRDSGQIFPRHEQTISKYFKSACDDLGIPDLHFHDLRHEGVSRLFEAGMSIERVAMVSGHKDWRHLRRYTNLRPEDVHNC